MSDTTPAIVEIADVFPDAVKVVGTDLKVGDYVFDACGYRHKLVRVLILKRTVKFVRDDYPYPEYIGHDETITIVKGSRHHV